MAFGQAPAPLAAAPLGARHPTALPTMEWPQRMQPSSNNPPNKTANGTQKCVSRRIVLTHPPRRPGRSWFDIIPPSDLRLRRRCIANHCFASHSPRVTGSGFDCAGIRSLGPVPARAHPDTVPRSLSRLSVANQSALPSPRRIFGRGRRGRAHAVRQQALKMQPPQKSSRSANWMVRALAPSPVRFSRSPASETRLKVQSSRPSSSCSSSGHPLGKVPSAAS
jgi:hypothetical protein